MNKNIFYQILQKNIITNKYVFNNLTLYDCCREILNINYCEIIKNKKFYKYFELNKNLKEKELIKKSLKNPYINIKNSFLGLYNKNNTIINNIYSFDQNILEIKIDFLENFINKILKYFDKNKLNVVSDLKIEYIKLYIKNNNKFYCNIYQTNLNFNFYFYIYIKNKEFYYKKNLKISNFNKLNFFIKKFNYYNNFLINILKNKKNNISNIVFNYILLSPVVSYNLFKIFIKTLSFVDKNKISFKLDDKLNLFDNGIYKDVPSSTVVDDEGTEKQKNILIKNGILNKQITIRNLINTNNHLTGNAKLDLKGDIYHELNYLILKSGNISFNQIINKYNKIILIDQIDDINEESIDLNNLSLIINLSFYIENSKIDSIAEYGLLEGDFVEAMKKIVEISSESESNGEYNFPYILIENKNLKFNLL